MWLPIWLQKSWDQSPIVLHCLQHIQGKWIINWKRMSYNFVKYWNPLCTSCWYEGCGHQLSHKVAYTVSLIREIHEYHRALKLFYYKMHVLWLSLYSTVLAWGVDVFGRKGVLTKLRVQWCTLDWNCAWAWWGKLKFKCRYLIFRQLHAFDLCVTSKGVTEKS